MNNSSQNKIGRLLSNKSFVRRLCEVCLRIFTHRAEIARLKQKKRLGEEEMLLREHEWFLAQNEKLIDTLMSSHDRKEAFFDLVGIDAALTWIAWMSQTNMLNVDDLSEKFSNLSIRHFREIKKLLRTDHDGFLKFAEEYVQQKAIPLIRKGVEVNHLLHDRCEMILRSLKEYEAHRYLCACSLLVVQIEGLFGDLLEGMGMTREQIESQAIGNKVLVLNNKSDDFIWYEYYSFVFPILRNRIAHGNVRNRGLTLADAIRLILDFAQICDYVCNSVSIPINRKIAILKAFKKGKKDGRGRAMLDFVSVIDVTIPSFYGLQECERKLKKGYEQKSFALYVRSCLAEYSNDELDGLINSLGKIADKILGNNKLDELKNDVIKEKKVRKERAINLKKTLAEFKDVLKS